MFWVAEIVICLEVDASVKWCHELDWPLTFHALEVNEAVANTTRFSDIEDGNP